MVLACFTSYQTYGDMTNTYTYTYTHICIYICINICIEISRSICKCILLDIDLWDNGDVSLTNVVVSHQ